MLGETMVALLARAWIEIRCNLCPVWPMCVALLARAWIEISHSEPHRHNSQSRSPCESVD